MNTDEARYERMNRMNQSDYAPGQNETFHDDSDIASIFNTGVNGSQSLFDNQPLVGGEVQQPVVSTSAEEKILGSMLDIGKKSFGIAQDIIESFKGLTALFWLKYGITGFIMGGILGATGLVTAIFGYSKGWGICTGGLILSAISIIIGMSNVEKAKTCSSQYTEDNSTSDEKDTTLPDFNDESLEDFGNSDEGSDAYDDYGEDDGDYDDYEEDDDWNFDEVTEPEIVIEKPMTEEEALSVLIEVPVGMYTRQYLYDAAMRVLPSVTPNFARIVNIDDEDDEFYDWEEKLRDAAEVTGCNEENLPELSCVSKSLFTVVLECTRPAGLKVEQVAKELANIVSYQNGRRNARVYATVVTVGKKCIFTVNTGDTAMISWKDLMLRETEFVLDSSNYIPVFLGIDQEGKVLMCDFKDVESMIITGMPRMGKSWLAQCIMAQMVTFVSPTELHIYILDPKEGISDFKSFVVPHVKKFESDDTRILDTLRKVVKQEAPKRKKLLGDHGCVNIWDFKKANPNITVPIIYVLIDEVVTLASRMDKDTKVEFRMLLRELISQLPALGIRAILIPHILNDEIIEKKTSDLVPFRVSVCGDEDHIEKATGVKRFPNRLVNKGDNAIRLSIISPTPFYCHSCVLTKSNDGNKEYIDYIRKVWMKLEPDSIKDSVAKEYLLDEENRNMLKRVESDMTVNLW